YIYLPHLDYAAQRSGPNSKEATTALRELDALLGQFFQGVDDITNKEVLWLVASEYAIVPVDHVSYPNRILRDAGFLNVYQDDGEWIDFRNSRAWALVDHQFSHIYLQQTSQDAAEEIAGLFRDQPGIDEVLVGDEKKKYGIDHLRSGEIILISSVNSWQAYYYWNEDEQAPPFARSVDIHRKPGYDPVELFFDHQTKSIPLDATLVSGSHGAPIQQSNQRGLFASSQAGLLKQSGFEEGMLQDREVCRLVLDQF
ncbi:MAG: alkaline phosphatase family protein, partial [Pirellulales bacterium]|nr:alkaline phosphatase family protein [Pirellulales bacterium]